MNQDFQEELKNQDFHRDRIEPHFACTDLDLVGPESVGVETELELGVVVLDADDLIVALVLKEI